VKTLTTQLWGFRLALLLPLLSLLLGEPVWAQNVSEGTTSKVTYGKGLKDWNLLFNLLNTAAFRAYILKTNVSLRDLEQALSHRVEFPIGTSAFRQESYEMSFTGEREWSLLTGGTRFVLADPTHSEIVRVAHRISEEATRWRPNTDPLQLARFQNDLDLSIRALKSYLTNGEYDLRGFQIDKTNRSQVLISELEKLYKKTLMTKDEIESLPNTENLGIVNENGLLKTFIRWTNANTIHEEVNFGTIATDLYVIYRNSRTNVFAPDVLKSIIAKGALPDGECVYVMLDRLIVTDTDHVRHRTQVTTLARSERFFADGSRPYGNEVGQFDLYYLRRAAQASNWLPFVERADENEFGGAMANLPNVPGWKKIYFQVPLRESCLGCHGLGPRVFGVAPPGHLRPVLNALYTGTDAVSTVP
jgi:hypothetical protein